MMFKSNIYVFCVRYLTHFLCILLPIYKYAAIFPSLPKSDENKVYFDIFEHLEAFQRNLLQNCCFLTLKHLFSLL